MATKADAVKVALLNVNGAIGNAMQRDVDTVSDPVVTQAFGASNDAQVAFALAANLEVAKRRPFWKKYPD